MATLLDHTFASMIKMVRQWAHGVCVQSLSQRTSIQVGRKTHKRRNTISDVEGQAREGSVGHHT